MTRLLHHPQFKDTGDSIETINGEPVLVTRLEVENTTTYIDKDGSDNMTFTDAVTGTKTLAQLSAGGAGGVDTSGTPEANDYAQFTDADTVRGRDTAEVKTDLSLNLVENTAHSTDAHTMTIDGRDVSVDGTKLDTIATNADVTGSNVPQAHASTHDSGGSDQIHSIADDDDDTKWQMEESADEDIARLDIAGTERVSFGDDKANVAAGHWLFGSDAGILTTPKQSGAKVYLGGGDQICSSGALTKVQLNTESWDIQNEFNSSVISGTATVGTGGTTLIDSGASFVGGDVGKTVWNTKAADPDEGKSTTIASVDSGTQVTLTADIGIDNTDTYKYGFCRFTATEAGIYFCSACIRYLAMGDAKYVFAVWEVNGAVALVDEIWSAAAGGDIYKGVHGFVQLAATDYVELFAMHGEGSNITLEDGVGDTFGVIQKVA